MINYIIKTNLIHIFYSTSNIICKLNIQNNIQLTIMESNN